MRNTQPSVINDINRCLEDAQVVASQLTAAHENDEGIFRAFTSLAGNETIGLLAYVIWRGRARLLSSLRSASIIRYDGATRVRHTRT